jgi:hypothetical protein
MRITSLLKVYASIIRQGTGAFSGILIEVIVSSLEHLTIYPLCNIFVSAASRGL